MKKWICASLVAALLLAGGGLAEASLFGRVLGRVFSASQSTQKKPVKQPAGNASKTQKYKNAMGALENLQWVGVAKSSGGNIYFNQDTLNDRQVQGERRVTATVKDEFSDEGAKEIVEESDGQLSSKHRPAYSLFLVDFGEKDSFVASRVTYYDKEGKTLLDVPASAAFSDVTTRAYGKPYPAGSIEKRMQQTVFTYADRVKEEEKEAAAQNGS